MSEKFIGEMDDQLFEQMVHAFIDRSTKIDEEIPAELILAMLDKAEQPKQALALDSVVIDDRLIISTPTGTIVPTNVSEIKINLPNVRLIVKVAAMAAAMAA